MGIRVKQIRSILTLNKFSKQDFDNAIADLEAQITELKAKYPEFVAKANSFSSEFRGVYRTLSGRYSSRYRGTYIGVYSTPKEAARAYDLAVSRFYGEGCVTNFAVEGIETKVLFPDYPEIKHRAIDLLISKDMSKSTAALGRKFKGVSKRTFCSKYQAQYSYKGKLLWLGGHNTPESAARAYDLKAIELRGEGCTTNFAVEGVKTNVLFPDYPATKRHKVSELAPKPVEPMTEPIQLNMVTLDDETDDNHEETIYDRMRAYALENGIELKTMQFA